MRAFVAVLLVSFFSGTLALAADRPDWAFPPKQQQPVVAVAIVNKPLQVPGSDRSYTMAEINDQMAPPDWFPNEHPPMPTIVAHGNGTTVRACIGCHLPQGLGHPENSRLAGSTAAYLERQMADFKNDVRGGEGARNSMTKFSKLITEDEVRAASEYFASLKPTPWTQVIETDTVPKTYFEGTRRLQTDDGASEPIGERIIEVPKVKELVERRDPHASFVSYVPIGSVAKGEFLVTTGGGKAVPCATCHGVGLRGIADVPDIAGRSPGQIAREVYYFQTGPSAALMKPVVENLTGDDVLAISAYVASLKP
jgi:cytochrome c553